MNRGQFVRELKGLDSQFQLDINKNNGSIYLIDMKNNFPDYTFLISITERTGQLQVFVPVDSNEFVQSAYTPKRYLDMASGRYRDFGQLWKTLKPALDKLGEL